MGFCLFRKSIGERKRKNKNKFQPNKEWKTKWAKTQNKNRTKYITRVSKNYLPKKNLMHNKPVTTFTADAGWFNLPLEAEPHWSGKNFF